MTGRIVGAIAGAAIAASLLMAPSSPFVASSAQPCSTEDAAGPCTWDAQTQGNGKGRSFTVAADGTVTYK